MQAVWDEVAPPPYISLAAMIGFKPKRREGVFDSPEDMAAAMQQMFGPGSTF